MIPERGWRARHLASSPKESPAARRLSIGVGLLIYSTADSTLWAWGLPPQLAGGAERFANGVVLGGIIEGNGLLAAWAWHAEAVPNFSEMLPERLPALGAFNSDLVGWEHGDTKAPKSF